MGVAGFGYKIRGPVGVFTAELSALFTALWHIAEVIRPPKWCLILTDSLSLVKTMLSRRLRIKLTLWSMNVKSRAEACARRELRWSWCRFYLTYHELVEDRARQAALEGTIFKRPLSSSDFQSLARPALLIAWQAKCNSADTGPFYFSRCDPLALVWGPKGGEKVCMTCVKGFIWKLMDRILVDFELLKMWCVCVCRWLWDSDSLDLELWKVSSANCHAECEHWGLHSWFVCIEKVVCRKVLLGLP
jgi:hypothetical protein